MEKEFLNPKEVLENLNLKEDLIAADFGCGSGGWAIPLAKILKRGRVFAIDILEEPLSALRSKAKMEKLFNIDTLKQDVEKGVSLTSESCDLVLMTNLLFEVDDIEKVLNEGKRILKKGGKILIVDWKENAKIGPEKRISPQKVKEIGEKIGLKLEKEFEAGIYHYGILFSKL